MRILVENITLFVGDPSLVKDKIMTPLRGCCIIFIRMPAYYHCCIGHCVWVYVGYAMERVVGTAAVEGRWLESGASPADCRVPTRCGADICIQSHAQMLRLIFL